MSGARLDRWIHGFLPVSAEGLSASRIIYASFFLLTGIPTYSWVSGNPPAFFTAPPLSLAALFGGFPPAGVVRALDVSICILFIFVLTGFKTGASSILLSLSLILGNSFRFSFGKIDHSILAVITPAIMAIAGWGSRFSIDSRRRSGMAKVRAWPVTLMALLVAFGFLSAGLPKLLAWVDFDVNTHGVRSWLLNAWYVMGRRRLLVPYFMTIDNPYFWEALDLVAVTFEVGFILSLARRELFRTYLFIAVMFHLTNLFMLNIPFISLVSVYAVFAPWDDVLTRLPRSPRLLGAVGTFGAMAALLPLFLPLYLLIDRVPVDTAANTFSHLGILAALTGSVDYGLLASILAWTAALGAALAFAGMPRRAGSAPAEIDLKGRPTVFFDGVCNLCNGFVDFLIRHDRAHTLRFASLQSATGEKVVEAAGAPRSRPQGYYTIYFVDVDGWIYERSDAVLRILLSLGGAFRLLGAFWTVPRVVRDRLYRVVSRFRYSLFGRRSSCRLPTPEERALFV